MPGIVVDGILEDGDGQLEELLRIQHGACVEHVDQRGEVHGPRYHLRVVTVKWG